MIKVENLVKRYGGFAAVDDISFQIGAGEVVGFLGPNGAGKTTTLKALTGYFEPSQGSVAVAGFNVLEHPTEVKQIIGYLPENNPLYEDMETAEYLLWSGTAHGLKGEKLRAAAKTAIEECGLADAVGKPISRLSKGYRQRVGIASAILHNPRVLLLDEPTSGLDPNQALEVRELITELGAKKTILLSTHILSEAKITCSRVIIINKGKIAAQGTPDDLTAGIDKEHKTMLITERVAHPAAVRESLSLIKGALACSLEEKPHEFVFTLTSPAGKDLRKDIFLLAAQNSWPVLELRRETVSLEEVFRRLTL